MELMRTIMKTKGGAQYIRENISKVVERLAAYEDTGLSPERVTELAKLEKDGRLIELPCAIESSVYRIEEDEETIKEFKVCLIDLSADKIILHAECSDKGDECCDCCSYGETCDVYFNLKYMSGMDIFFTREEAKAEIEKRKGDEMK